MRFTEDIRLATLVLTEVPYLKPIKNSAFAVQLKTTEPYLSQIVAKLRRAGLVQVKKGPKGGVFAGATPFAITVLDVFKALGRDKSPESEGSFLENVHTNVLNLLAAERIPYRGLETGGSAGEG